MEYHFGGWATRNNLLCSDGRTIMKDAFKVNDGQTVPLVWNHQHNDPHNVLGHALLENRDDGVYAYCEFNDTDSGQNAKLLVEHGDVSALSIFANNLKQQGANVLHGIIREVSLVLAGANPGAFIDSVMVHDDESGESAIIYTGEPISLCHADATKKEDDDKDTADEAGKEKPNESKKKEDSEGAGEKAIKDILAEMTEEQQKVVYVLVGMAITNETIDSINDSEGTGEKTIEDVLDEMTEEQRNVVYALVGMAVNNKTSDSDNKNNNNDSEGGDKSMKQNLFSDDKQTSKDVICHADQMAILELAKKSTVGSFQEAMAIYAEENELQHGDDAVSSGFVSAGDGNITNLFPEYKEVRPGAPELITNDQGWITVVMNKVHKSPISRIRTSQVDIRNIEALRAKGYQKGKQKSQTGNFSLIRRTTDPQTVYVKSALHRDDIVDITDFDYVAYLYGIDRMQLNEELAVAIMLGDGREDGDEGKIFPDKIRPIWLDDELYTLHTDLDLEAAKKELQGSNTSVNFGENYVYAEAMINAVLYAREKYKGSGIPDYFCTPHALNVMLLARDLNGRRIYNSKAELASALNVGDIYTAEQFEGKTRKTGDSKTKKLLGIVTNLADYSLGATKGGEITHFHQFDIDFNQEKSLLETRCSGALTRVYSAIAIEQDVTNAE